MWSVLVVEVNPATGELVDDRKIVVASEDAIAVDVIAAVTTGEYECAIGLELVGDVAVEMS